MSTTVDADQMHAWVATTYSEDGFPVQRAAFSTRLKAKRWVEFVLPANVEWSSVENGETRTVVTGYTPHDPPTDDGMPPAIIDKVEMKDAENFRKIWIDDD